MHSMMMNETLLCQYSNGTFISVDGYVTSNNLTNLTNTETTINYTNINYVPSFNLTYFCNTTINPTVVCNYDNANGLCITNGSMLRSCSIDSDNNNVNPCNYSHILKPSATSSISATLTSIITETSTMSSSIETATATITPNIPSSPNGGTIAGAVVGSFFGIAIIGAFVYCIVIKRIRSKSVWTY